MAACAAFDPRELCHRNTNRHVPMMDHVTTGVRWRGLSSEMGNIYRLPGGGAEQRTYLNFGYPDGSVAVIRPPSLFLGAWFFRFGLCRWQILWRRLTWNGWSSGRRCRLRAWFNHALRLFGRGR